MGYHRAGFDVVGVDIKPQPRYPFEFHQGDALEFIAAHGHEFDVIHASPPCQAFTALNAMWNSREHPDLLTPCRELLKSLGVPYVIENVPGAPMHDYLVLCGTMFNLGTGDAELRRHRHFEIDPPIYMRPMCNHYWRSRVIGVYGGHGRDRKRVPTITVAGNVGGYRYQGEIQHFSVDQRREAMGIDWMTGNELSQAIPPAYTEYIGLQLFRAVESEHSTDIALW